MGFFKDLKHSWNAFLDLDDNRPTRGSLDYGPSYSTQPSRSMWGITGDSSIKSSIYARIAIDFASNDLRHVRLDDLGRYKEDMRTTGLQNCLTVEANIDQSARAFKQDIALTLLNEGTIAIVPVDTSDSPEGMGSVDIRSMRVGKVVQWFPQHVRIDLYNEQTGRHEQITLHKSAVALVENPLYSVMNEPNGTLKRLTRTLSNLDTMGEQSASGKLDMIIQLPFQIRSDLKRQQANQRRVDLEAQLAGSKYGIAYADATEKITQLNRPAENNLLAHATFLTEMLYAQLGLTPSVMDGTADEATMLNYLNRTIEPLLRSVAEEMKRKFISKTARTQGQSVEYFNDPFKLVPMSELAELADKLTRNEVVSANEIRQAIGLKPSDDPKADELRNSNMPQALDPPSSEVVPGEVVDNQPVDDPFAGINDTLDSVFKELGEEP